MEVQPREMTIKVSSDHEGVTVEIQMPVEGVSVMFTIEADQAKDLADGLRRAALSAQGRVEWGKN